MLVNQRVEKLSNIKKNSIIKMDVEGDETKILKNSVLKNAYKIMIEYHNTIEECVEILKKQGFRTSIKDDHLEKGMRLGYIKAWR
jgi:hypothetical protein